MRNHEKKSKIGEFLIEKGLISEDQWEIAAQEKRKDEAKDKMIGSILVEMGFITETALSQAVSESTGVQAVDLNSTILDSAIIKMVPKDVAVRSKAIPISMNDEQVVIAMTDIYNLMIIDQMRKFFPKNLKFVPAFAQESFILEAIDKYHNFDMSIDNILKEIEDSAENKIVVDSSGNGYVNPTVRLVDAFLIDAIKKGASDIHFEPEDSFLRLRYRIDGVMTQIRSFHKGYWPAIAVRIKIISNMNIAETRHPQDGRISFNFSGREIDFRVATQPTIHGENIVMRILDKKQSLVPIEELGLSKHNQHILKKLLQRPEGIIIVTGPTGSGKTTTLYSILGHINSIEQNIMTLEDPVEYQLALIRQSQIKEGSGMDFKEGIKSLLRQDPDIIFVGEVRDHDTATMAIRAAMTGHQVYTTLHTNDAIAAIPRLVDIGVKPSMIAGSLICVIAQRLARRLCEECKMQRFATEEECEIMNKDPNHPPMVFEPVGCEKCGHKGYKGRVAIHEILPIDRQLDELIATSSTRKAMRDYALEHDFVPMSEDGILKVLQGITDVSELVKKIDMINNMH